MRKQKAVKPTRGRPVTHPMPDLIPDTPENIVRAVLRSPAVPRGGGGGMEVSQGRAQDPHEGELGHDVSRG